jgi:5,10-methylenetetrahydromethanopterin reductase
MEVSTQFWPWYSAPEMVEAARMALRSYPYEYIWLCDEYQYEDTLTVLGLMANELDTSVGPMVTFPWRNPLDLAQRFSTLSKFARPGRKVALGIGAGGAVQVQVLGEKTFPVSLFEESVHLIRRQLSGETVDLVEFPGLIERFRLNPKTRAKLYFPPQGDVPIYVAAGAPKTCGIAGRYGDGVVISQLVVRTSQAGVRSGLVKDLLGWVDDSARAAGRAPGSVKKIYAGHISVSRDGQAARDWAKRNSSYGLSGTYFRDPAQFEAIGIDPEEVAPVAEAYRLALGLEVAASRVTDSVLKRAGLVIAGTPDECIESFRELRQNLEALGFDHLIFGVPVGPNMQEALDLLGKEVIPGVMA